MRCTAGLLWCAVEAATVASALQLPVPTMSETAGDGPLPSWLKDAGGIRLTPHQSTDSTVDDAVDGALAGLGLNAGTNDDDNHNHPATKVKVKCLGTTCRVHTFAGGSVLRVHHDTRDHRHPQGRRHTCALSDGECRCQCASPPAADCLDAPPAGFEPAASVTGPFHLLKVQGHFGGAGFYAAAAAGTIGACAAKCAANTACAGFNWYVRRE
jgi:hypothetical protein